jgi:hypothetical protein
MARSREGSKSAEEVMARMGGMSGLRPVTAEEAFRAMTQVQQAQYQAAYIQQQQYAQQMSLQSNTLGYNNTWTNPNTTSTSGSPLVRRDCNRDVGWDGEGRAYSGTGGRYPELDETAVMWLDRRVNEIRVRL